jgi:hypothetical protein
MGKLAVVVDIRTVLMDIVVVVKGSLGSQVVVVGSQVVVVGSQVVVMGSRVVVVGNQVAVVDSLTVAGRNLQVQYGQILDLGLVHILHMAVVDSLDLDNRLDLDSLLDWDTSYDSWFFFVLF